MNDEYSQRCRAVLSVLVERDPLELADPENSLLDEYEPEAREIARLAPAASADPEKLRAMIQRVFVQQFDARISEDDLAMIIRAAG